MAKKLAITKLQVLIDKDQISHQFIFSDEKSFVIDKKNARYFYHSKNPEDYVRIRYDIIPLKYLLLIRKYYKNDPNMLNELLNSRVYAKQVFWRLLFKYLLFDFFRSS